jgi:hypothetical protein
LNLCYRDRKEGRKERRERGKKERGERKEDLPPTHIV